MSNLEIIDQKTAKLSFDISPEDFEKAINAVYNKHKNRINIPGFRKGRAPRAIIENYYGKDFFYNDAINHDLDRAYTQAMSEHEDEIETVGMPDFNLSGISDDKVVSMTATLTLYPKASVSEYKNLPFKPFDASVSEEEVEKFINNEREKNARIMNVERPVENGDLVNLNCEGYVDGHTFEGGKVENYDLTIGSHSFVDTFEEQLIGKNVNEDVEVNVTFPEDYHMKEVAGKPAMFKVKINKVSVKELPELNDDFVQDVSEFNTVDEYRNSVRAKLEEDKQKQARTNKENQLADALVKNTTVEIPQVMIDDAAKNMLHNLEHNLTSQGLSLESYLQYMGQTRETMLNMYKPNAQRDITFRLALEYISTAENLVATQEDVDKEVDKIVEQTKIEKEKIMSLLNKTEKKRIERDILVQKALDFVVESAVEKEQNDEEESNSEDSAKENNETENSEANN